MISATKHHLRQRCQHHSFFPGSGFFVMLNLVNSWVNALGLGAQAQTSFSPEQLNFFESKIRPVLIKNCREPASKGGLRE